jgi:hypothetical protein
MIVRFGVHFLSLFVPVSQPAPPPPLPPVVIVTTTITRPAPTTTTTTRPAQRSTLDVAQAEVGQSGVYADGGFWCAKFATWVLNAAGYDIRSDGPAQLKQMMPATDSPSPGDLVFINLMADDSGQTSHVAVVESINPDGSVNTVEGNGPSTIHVARGVRLPSEITGYGDVDQLPRQSQPIPYVPFEDPICAIKPWVCPGWEN